MRQDGSVDLVRFDLGFGDRLHLERVGEHDLVYELVEPVEYHRPVAGRFHHRMGIVGIAVEKPRDRSPIVPHAARANGLAAAILNDDVAVRSVVVDADVIVVGHGCMRIGVENSPR